MTDFTIVAVQQCKKLSQQSMKIGTYMVTGLGREHTYPACTCPAYKYGKRNEKFGNQYYPKTCKHIDEAIRLMSCWHSQWDGEAQSDDQQENMICPVCGGPTEWVNVAV